jgi:peptidoglycan/xylan/chitin deacetylase (PgdA/CDA1 family)
VIDHGAQPVTQAELVSHCPVSSYGPQFYAPSIPGGGKTVALTFDDGPGPSTASIVSILEAFGVRATFFNVGLQEAAWPAEVVAEERAGFLVGSHTWNHPDMVKLTAARQASELDMVAAKQEALTDTSPCVFRPPYGDYDATTLRLAEQRHMGVWMWNVDTEDYEAEGSPSAYWVDRIVSLAESEGGVLQHPVVVLHNQEIPMPATVAALPLIIRYFQSHGYTFVDLLGNIGPPASCAPSGSLSRPVSATLVESGRLLGSGDVVDSPGAQYHLVMEPDGDLVLEAAGGRTLWSSGTGDSPGAFALMQPDGNFAIYSASDQVLWETGTEGHPGADLAVESNADLVMYDRSERVWSSGSSNSGLSPGEHLEPGWYLDSPAGTCRLVMKRDGNLVLYASDGRTLWSSETPGSPGAFAVMDSDGNLAVYSASDHLLWQTKTTRSGAWLYVRQQADTAIELASGAVVWLAT